MNSLLTAIKNKIGGKSVVDNAADPYSAYSMKKKSDANSLKTPIGTVGKIVPKGTYGSPVPVKGYGANFSNKK